MTSERIRGREKLLPWRRPGGRSPLDSDIGRGPDVRPAHCEVETLRPPLLPPLLLRAVLLLVGTAATPTPDPLDFPIEIYLEIVLVRPQNEVKI